MVVVPAGGREVPKWTRSRRGCPILSPPDLTSSSTVHILAVATIKGGVATVMVVLLLLILLRCGTAWYEESLPVMGEEVGDERWQGDDFDSGRLRTMPT